MHSDIMTSFRGHFLLAMPGMDDPNFDHAVTCICEHASEGALGINIHQELEGVSIRQIYSELNLPCASDCVDYPLYLGGPVQNDRVFVLHGPPFSWDGSYQITPELGLTNSIDILQSMARGHGPDDVLVSIGCAGWGPKQLDEEIMQNVWLTSPVDLDIVFQLPSEQRWDQALKRCGIDPLMISDNAGSA